MEFTNLLTIAIPVFERKEFFVEAIESALNQTVKCEVIVVDNCSSHDYFEKICNEKGVTYIRNDSNIGLFPNINRCYNLAKTEYVKVLDDDDLLASKYVESFLRAIQLHPDIDVFFTDYASVTSRGGTSHPFDLTFGYMENGIKIIENAFKCKLGFPYMTCTIKKSKAQLDLDINDCYGGYDWEWVYSNAHKLSFYGEPERFHIYRIHDKKASPKYWQYNVLTVSYIYDLILLPKISNTKLIRKLTKQSFRELIRIKLASNKKELRKIINSDNRYGKYLKAKLTVNIYLRIIFLLPSILIRFVFKPLSIINWLCHFSYKLQ